MSDKSQTKKLTSSKIKVKHGWEGAAAQAEAKILNLRLRIMELQKAIQIFKQNADHGEPWLPEQVGYAQKAGVSTASRRTEDDLDSHWRKCVRASSSEQSMFHLIAMEIGEQRAFIVAARLGWKVESKEIPPVRGTLQTKRGF